MRHRGNGSFDDRLQANIASIRKAMGESSDFMVREITTTNKHNFCLFYLDGMSDQQTIQEHVISPLLDRVPERAVTLELIQKSVLDASDVKLVHTMDQALDKIISGCLLLLMHGHSDGLAISLPGWEDRSITESKTNPIVRGPGDSFIETLRTNTTLVRRRVRDARLRVCTITIGSQSKTDVAMMYIEGTATRNSCIT